MKDAPVMLIMRKRQNYDIIETQFLLLKRTSDHPLFPNEWCLPGGKREWIAGHNIIGFTYIESNEEAIYRECEEELGCKIHVFKDTHITMIDDHYQMKVYLALSDIQVTKQFPNREHIQYHWFHRSELPENLSEVTRQLIENFNG